MQYGSKAKSEFKSPSMIRPAANVCGLVDADADMDSVMAECGFASTTYAPSATTAVEGITIVAMIPTVVPKGQKGASGSAAPSQDPSAEMDSGGVRSLSGFVVCTAAQALWAGFLAMLVAF